MLVELKGEVLDKTKSYKGAYHNCGKHNKLFNT